MTYFTKFQDVWHGSMIAALTACMALGLANVARSATPDAAPSVKVSYGDLDLANAQGVNTLHARVTAAAREVCAPHGFDIRDLKLFTIERSCMSQAVANAERAVPGLKVASLSARRDQG